MYTIQDYVFLISVVVIAASQLFIMIRLIINDHKSKKVKKLYLELCSYVLSLSKNNIEDLLDDDDDETRTIIEACNVALKQFEKYI